jgi:DNA gyrase subunit A
MARRRPTEPTLPLDGSEPPPPAPVDDQDLAAFAEPAFLEYALAVNGSRQVPDVRDGLKPVHRRILWSMWTQGLRPDRPFVKCARITGDVIAKYHPHGDTSVYEALVGMAQPFSMSVPLVDFHGNYGSPDFPAAASRYTECRPAPAALALLDGIESGTVDLLPNFDGLEDEPVVLPASFPNLLVNGTFGIGVGLSTAIPPHNPGEVAAAALHLVANPDASIEDLMVHLPGPDFPTAGQIVDAESLVDVYRSGRGRVALRGRWTVEEGKRGAKRIIITELPFARGAAVSTTEVGARIVKLVTDGRLSGIRDVRNESAEDAVRLVVELRPEANAEQVVGILLKDTNLQVTVPVRMIALTAAGVPQLFNLRGLLDAWIAHRTDVIERRSRHRLEVIAERLHVLDGLLVCLLDLDAVIALVRASDDRAAARTGLMERFGLTELQANYVLDLTLGRLTRLARLEIEQEAEALRTEQAELTALVSDPSRLRAQVGVELAEAATAFTFGRRTEITGDSATIDTTITVPDEPITVCLTARGYVQAFKVGGRGAKSPKDAVVAHRIAMSTASQLVVLTSSGQLHRLLGAGLPFDKPSALPNVIDIADDESIVHVCAAADLPADISVVTAGGQLKRSSADILTGGDRKGGIRFCGVAEGDRIVAVVDTTGDPELLVVTQKGHGIRFWLDDVRPMGNTASGVRAIKLGAGDRVIGAIRADAAPEALIVHGSGHAKRVDMTEFYRQGRAGVGVRVATIDKRRSPLVAVLPAPSTQSRYLVTEAGPEAAVTPVTAAGAAPAGRDAAGTPWKGAPASVATVVPAPPDES